MNHEESKTKNNAASRLSELFKRLDILARENRTVATAWISTLELEGEQEFSALDIADKLLSVNKAIGRLESQARETTHHPEERYMPYIAQMRGIVEYSMNHLGSQSNHLIGQGYFGNSPVFQQALAFLSDDLPEELDCAEEVQGMLDLLDELQEEVESSGMSEEDKNWFCSQIGGLRRKVEDYLALGMADDLQDGIANFLGAAALRQDKMKNAPSEVREKIWTLFQKANVVFEALYKGSIIAENAQKLLGFIK